MSKPVLQIDDLVAAAGAFTLGPLQLSLCAGEHLCVLGPNGSGKSTLVKSIMGGVASTGSIVVQGRDARGMSLFDRVHIIGYVPQNLVSCPRGVRVADFLMHGRYLYKDDFRTGHVQRLCERVVEQTNCGALLSEEMHNLSGGEVQRVVLASVLLQEPSVLLLDEPTAHLDPREARSFYQSLKPQIAKGTLSVISVLHDFYLALEEGDRIVGMRLGKIIFNEQAKCCSKEQVLASIYGVGNEE